MLKKFLLICAMLAAAWCAAQPPKEAGKIRAGLYVDHGSRGSGALYWARLLADSPQIELVLLEGEDLRQGKLDTLDLLVMPGGASGLQMKSMGKAGAEAVRRFVANGGAYVGTCAGMHCTMNKPDRLGLLPFTRLDNASGAEAALSVEFTPEGAKRFGIPPGRQVVRYSHGPVVAPAARPGEGRCEVVATYSSSITPLGRENRSFFGTPSALFGEYGKGKVAVTSFHPESYASTRCIALGMIYATTGVKPTVEFPGKSFRPLRVGYFSRAIVGKRCTEDALALDREAEFDVRFTDCADIDTGALEHLDAMIFADGYERRYERDLTPRRRQAISDFMRRGGRVIASGVAVKYLPEHTNLIVKPENRTFAEVLKSLSAAK